MANAQACGDRAIRRDPCQSVNLILLPHPSHVAVSKFDGAAGPKDAPVFVRPASAGNSGLEYLDAWGRMRISHGVRSLRCCGQGRVSVDALPGPSILA